MGVRHVRRRDMGWRVSIRPVRREDVDARRLAEVLLRLARHLDERRRKGDGS